jgi:peptidoglycan hydrolase-like protein with peptidoglycan-binding domain
MQISTAARYSLLTLMVLLLLANVGFTNVLGYGDNTATRVKSRVQATNSVTMPRHNFAANLSLGMQTSDVLELQKRLRELGHFSFPTDTGYFGPVTREAVMSFQAAHNLPITGFVGPLTRGLLNQTP